MVPLPSPASIKKAYPLSASLARRILQKRHIVGEILENKDPRFLLVVGPCSIHEERGICELARALHSLEREVADTFVFIFRTFFEKSRTRYAWKGFLFDASISQCERASALERGIQRARALALALVEEDIAIGGEMVEPLLAPYLDDLFVWGCIGARTSYSQPHRALASLLPFPMGFKNALDGSLEGALFGIEAAATPQVSLGMNEEGRAVAISTSGNPHTHLILRGGYHGSNAHVSSLKEVEERLHVQKLPLRLLIDCAHGNSQKDPKQQEELFNMLIRKYSSRSSCTSLIKGWMLETHLFSGRDDSPAYGISFTDPCLSLATTERLLLYAKTFLRDVR